MTEEQGTQPPGRRAWSVETFKRFWSDPDPAVVPRALTDDVVGYWSGREEPVRGKEAYTACIAALVEGLPGMTITVAEHASNGEFTFIRWIMHATGVHGPFEFSGIDRVRTRGDGLVAENRVVCDTSAFKALAGKELPWISLA
jgi:SnoaL-like domain